MKKRFTLILVLLACYTSLVSAQVHPLDPTFNDSGMVQTVLDEDSRSTKVVVQPDGKILVIGYKGYPRKWVLARYLDDGSLDQAFGVNGIVSQDLNEGVPNSVHVAEDGKILVSGFANHNGYDRCDYALVQFLPNGAIDSAFGKAGIIVGSIDSTRRNMPAAMIVTEQRIVMVGSSVGSVWPDSGTRGFFARYYRNGSLDTTFFGDDGRVIFKFENDGGVCLGAYYLPDGRIVTLSEEDAGNGYTSIRMRYFNWDGSLDKLTIPANPGNIFHPSYGTSMYMTSDNKLIVAGPAKSQTSVNTLIAVKMNADGSKDNSFEFDPVLVGSGYIYYVSIVERQDKCIFFTGQATNNGYGHFLVKCLPDGSLDTSFGNRGVLLPNLPSSQWGEGGEASLAADSNNKILLAGTLAYSGSPKSFAHISVKRYLDKSVSTVDPYATTKAPMLVTPHPIANKFTLHYDLPAHSQVSCDLYTLEGRFLVSLFSDYRSPGSNTEELILNEGISPGCYIVRLNTPRGSQDLQVIKQ